MSYTKKPDNRPAQSINGQMVVFEFSETKNELRTIIEDGSIYFVGSDVAKALGYARPDNAIRQHCRYALKRCIPHPQNPEKVLKVLSIPEGDVYRLIINSELESAQKFESWVMDEVLPSLRKNGFYKMGVKQSDFIDARDVPYQTEVINNYNVRVVFMNEKLYVVSDLCRSIQTTTNNGQIVKKLNAKRTLAWKVWLFGQTNPAWCTNELGKSLLFSGSRIERNRNQMLLPFNQEGGVQ